MTDTRLTLIQSYLKKNSIKNNDYTVFSLYDKNLYLENASNILAEKDIDYEIVKSIVIDSGENFLAETIIFDQKQLLLIKKITSNHTIFINENLQELKVLTSEFLALDNKFLLITKNKNKNVRDHLIIGCLWLLLIVILSFIFKLEEILNVLFGTLGIYLSYKSYLIQKRYNETDLWFCNLNDKTNCSKVIGTKKSESFLKISPTDISMVFFIFFLLVVIGRFQDSNLMLLSYISLLSILWSLGEQIRIRQFCMLCLLICLLLVSIFINTSIGYILEFNLKPLSFIFLILILAFSLLLWYTAKKAIDNIYNLKKLAKNQLRFKYDKRIFFDLLNTSEFIDTNDLEYAICIGEKDDNTKLSVFLDLFCDSCKEAYELLRENIENKDVLYRISFLYGKDPDLKNYVENLYRKTEGASDVEKIRVLDDWFINHNFHNFKQAEGINLNHRKQADFFLNNEIVISPTFVINKRKVNNIYTLQEILHFI
ncbi:vitamin K epoxide reductase family protein [Chryseobacterium sp.]|uniref:vitamin K epoxide reductase family protein n=1 Tax=Chryseobacterium sp. TaxID=1871047 RepID=UPI002FCAFD01